MRQLARHVAFRATRGRTAAAIVELAAIVAGVVVAAPAVHANNSYRITRDIGECGVMAVGVTGACIVSLQTWLNVLDGAGLVPDGGSGTPHGTRCAASTST